LPGKILQPANRDFIRVGRSRIEGKGIFAKRRIPRGTRIIEYTGDRVPLSTLLVESADGNVARIYAFKLHDDVIIDGARNGNDARFINHSCDPNCETYIFDDRVYVYAMREIVRGEELTFDYKLSPAFHGMKTRSKNTQFVCLCGAKNCRGTMLAPSRNRRIKK
jgi:SET domain-containing protein